jgi:phage terminase large subunit-like protein
MVRHRRLLFEKSPPPAVHARGAKRRKSPQNREIRRLSSAPDIL